MYIEELQAILLMTILNFIKIGSDDGSGHAAQETGSLHFSAQKLCIYRHPRVRGHRRKKVSSYGVPPNSKFLNFDDDF